MGNSGAARQFDSLFTGTTFRGALQKLTGLERQQRAAVLACAARLWSQQAQRQRALLCAARVSPGSSLYALPEPAFQRIAELLCEPWLEQLCALSALASELWRELAKEEGREADALLKPDATLVAAAEDLVRVLSGCCGRGLISTASP